MVDPATAALVATAVSAGAKGISDFFKGKNTKKQGKMKAKETRRETMANMAHEAHEGSSDLETHGMSNRLRKSKRRAKSMQDTTDIVRGAFNL